MSKLERAIGAILIVVIELFLIPVILPVMGNYSWVLLIVAIIFPVLVAWKGDNLKEELGG